MKRVIVALVAAVVLCLTTLVANGDDHSPDPSHPFTGDGGGGDGGGGSW